MFWLLRRVGIVRREGGGLWRGGVGRRSWFVVGVGLGRALLLWGGRRCSVGCQSV